MSGCPDAPALARAFLRLDVVTRFLAILPPSPPADSSPPGEGAAQYRAGERLRLERERDALEAGCRGIDPACLLFAVELVRRLELDARPWSSGPPGVQPGETDPVVGGLLRPCVVPLVFLLGLAPLVLRDLRDTHDRLARLFPQPTNEIALVSHDEVTGREFPNGALLLTFDDGPSPRHRSQLRAILAMHRVPGIFFLHGRSLLGDDEPIAAGACGEGGHDLGKHGMTHKPLDAKGLAVEGDAVARFQDRLDPFNAGRRWFRAPYGQPSEAFLDLVRARGAPPPVEHRQSRRGLASHDRRGPGPCPPFALLEGKGIVLFQESTAAAPRVLPSSLDLASKLGFRFVEPAELWRILESRPPGDP